MVLNWDVKASCNKLSKLAFGNNGSEVYWFMFDFCVQIGFIIIQHDLRFYAIIMTITKIYL